MRGKLPKLRHMVQSLAKSHRAAFILAAGLMGAVLLVFWLLSLLSPVQHLLVGSSASPALASLSSHPYAVLGFGLVSLLAASLYFYIDYQQHKQPLAMEMPTVIYTPYHHARVVTLPKLRYRSRLLSYSLSFGTVTFLLLAYSLSFFVQSSLAAPPSVTINQKAGTADPNPSYTSVFEVVFSEPIDKASFTAEDITLGGTAPNQQVQSITEAGSFDATVFDVRIQADSAGTIEPTIAAGGITSASSSDTNLASTSTDNSVTYNGDWTPDEFIVRVKTDNPGDSGDDEFVIRATTWDYAYSYDVDCNNDGTPDYTNQTDQVTCTYDTPGEYDIAISGEFPHWRPGPNQAKIIDIKQWGDTQWQSMYQMFTDAVNLVTFSAIDAPDLSVATNMSYVFHNATSFNSNINYWNVSNITDMMQAFTGAQLFNQPLNMWQTQNVTTMQSMFLGATSFNQDLGSWDVGNVTNMTMVFMSATSFDQSLATWNISSVDTMQGFFGSYVEFIMQYFLLVDYGGASLGDLTQEQKDALFDKLSEDGYTITEDNYQSFSSGLSTANYDATLTSWSQQSLQPNVTFDAGTSTYCNAEADRQSIVDTFSWTINDSGMNCESEPNDQRPFIITVKTDISDSNDRQFTIPTNTSDFAYDYFVDCDNDDTLEYTGQTDSVTCTYDTPGEYDIAISGQFPHWRDRIGASQAKIIDVKQWGDIEWQSMEGSFAQATNISAFSAIDAPDLSKVTDMSHMFYGATAFNQDISSWDTSNVTDMSSMFSSATSFNQPLNDWDVSSVTNMNYMFFSATSFNQPLNNWDVSRVISMIGMFSSATSFNQPLNDWDVSSVTYMGYLGVFYTGMFSSATSFNQPLNTWDVSNVIDMSGLFYQAMSFNQPLDDWDVSSVNNMSGIFMSATSFDQSLANWDVTNIEASYEDSEFYGMMHMFGNYDSLIEQLMDGTPYEDWPDEMKAMYGLPNSGLSTANYDATLTSWSQQSLQPNVTFDAGTSTYCNAEADRQSIIDNFSWTINDAGEAGDCELGDPPIVTTGPAAEITKDTATVSGTTTPGGLTERGIEYGTTTSYGQSLVDSSELLLHHHSLRAVSWGCPDEEDPDLVIGEEDLCNTYGVAGDSNGNVYVSDAANHRVNKYDANGNFIENIGSWGAEEGQFDSPRGIAVDSNNYLYVVDSYNARIQKFDSAGNFVMAWGSYGSADGQFEDPRDIAVDNDGNLLVIENWRVQKFDSSGNFISKFGSYGCYGVEVFEPGTFCYVSSIAVDSYNNIFTLDYFNNHVLKFDTAGNLLEHWGSYGTGDGQFYYPFGSLVIDSQDRVFVADTGNGRVQQFDIHGNHVTSYTFDDTEFSTVLPLGMGLDSYGRLIVSGSVDGLHVLSGIIEADLSGLSCATTYHYRAYATNSAGTGYGEDQTFTTAECDDEPDNPYEITNCEELQAIAIDRHTFELGDPAGNYKLMNDIDCSDTVNWTWDLEGVLADPPAISEGFIAIADLENQQPFTGSLDGQGYTISGLYQETEIATGLFGFTHGVTIENLNIMGLNVVAYGNVAAGLVSVALDSTIENVNVSGQIYADLSLAGYVQEIELGDITIEVPRSSSGAVGGLVAIMSRSQESYDQLTGEGRIVQSTADMQINVEVLGEEDSRPSIFVGGLAGVVEQNILDDVRADGNINLQSEHALALVGGLVGFSQVDTAEHNMPIANNATAGVNALCQSTASRAVVGGLYGSVIAVLTGSTTTAMQQSTASGDVDCAADSLMLGGLSGVYIGIGDEGGTHLQNVSASGDVTGLSTDPSQYEQFMLNVFGMPSIGEGIITESNGAGGLIGAAYSIGGRQLDNASASGHVEAAIDGVFAGGLIGASAGSNNELTNVHATGNVSAGAQWGGTAGGLIGGIIGCIDELDDWNDDWGDPVYLETCQMAMIEDSYATGQANSVGFGSAGGLIGSGGYASVNKAYATGDVSGYRAGGLVGMTSAFSTGHQKFNITNTYATGNVATISVPEMPEVATIMPAPLAGGLAGHLYGTIEDAYATGNVTLTETLSEVTSETFMYYGVGSAGGLVGWFVASPIEIDPEDTIIESLSIRDSFAAGLVTVPDTTSNISDIDATVSMKPGGLYGLLMSPAAFFMDPPLEILPIDVNSYYDQTRTGQDRCGGYATLAIDSFEFMADDPSLVTNCHPVNPAHSQPAYFHNNSANPPLNQWDFTTIWHTTCSYPLFTSLDETCAQAPTAPRNLHTTNRSTKSLTVAWQPPASDGGSPVTAYQLQYRRTGSSSWISAPLQAASHTSHTLTNLQPDTGYDFRVAAINAIGQGPYSSVLTARTLTEAAEPPVDDPPPPGPTPTTPTTNDPPPSAGPSVPTTDVTTNQPVPGSPVPVDLPTTSVAPPIPAPADPVDSRPPASPVRYLPFSFISLLLLVALAFALRAWNEYRRLQAVKRLLAAYAQTSADIQAFLRLIAHYLNTPLAILKNSLELITPLNIVKVDALAQLRGEVGALESFATKLQAEAQASLGATETSAAVQPPVQVGSGQSASPASPLAVLKEKPVWLPLLGIAAAVAAVDASLILSGAYSLDSLRVWNQLLLYSLLGLLVILSVYFHKRAQLAHVQQQALLDKQQALASSKQAFLGSAAVMLSEHHQSLVARSQPLHGKPAAKTYFNGLGMLGKLASSLAFVAKHTLVGGPTGNTNLQTVVQSVTSRYLTTAQARNVLLQVNIPADLHVRAHDDEVGYILEQLLDNAVKFSPDNSLVTVTATRSGRTVKLRVADQGPGLSPAARDQLFRPFERGTDSETFNVEGIGLGLHNVKYLVDRLGGRIEMGDNYPQGLVVEVILPAAESTVDTGAKQLGVA